MALGVGMSNSFHPHPVLGILKILVLSFIFTPILLLGMVLVGDLMVLIVAIFWAIAILKMLSIFLESRYHVVTMDEKAITYKMGIISHHNIVLPYMKISEASYSQGLLQRLFGVGTLRLDTAGGSRMAIYVHDVRYDDLKKIVFQVKEKSGKVDSI
jgi:putative membrane protein